MLNVWSIFNKVLFNIINMFHVWNKTTSFTVKSHHNHKWKLNKTSTLKPSNTRLHPGHFWYGLSVPVEIFLAIFQVFFGNISSFLQYFKFFAIFQASWQHFKIDSCMSLNLVPCSINIKCISWYKHTYSMHKWHQIQIHRNSKHSTEWWNMLFFL